MIEHTSFQTLSKLNIPVLTITDFEDQTIPIDQRSCYIVTARIHPGETNGSWVMHGLLQNLVSEKMKEDRKQFVFKIIPMLNPDGVVCGNYRSNLAGFDMNRQFKKQINPNLFPDLIKILDFVQDIKQNYQENVMAFIDLHGHSVKRNAFIYGPNFPISNQRYYSIRFLPFLLAQNSEAFKFKQCTFKKVKSKTNTGRIQIQKRFNIDNSYTLETSFGVYKSQNQVVMNQLKVAFDSKKFSSMGGTIVNTILDYNRILKENQRRSELKQQQRQNQKNQKHFKDKIEKRKTSQPQALTEFNNTKESITEPQQIQVEQSRKKSKKNLKKKLKFITSTYDHISPSIQFYEQFKQKMNDINQKQIYKSETKNDANNFNETKSDCTLEDDEIDCASSLSNTDSEPSDDDYEVICLFQDEKRVQMLQSIEKQFLHIQNNKATSLNKQEKIQNCVKTILKLKNPLTISNSLPKQIIKPQTTSHSVQLSQRIGSNHFQKSLQQTQQEVLPNIRNKKGSLEKTLSQFSEEKFKQTNFMISCPSDRPVRQNRHTEGQKIRDQVIMKLHRNSHLRKVQVVFGEEEGSLEQKRINPYKDIAHDPHHKKSGNIKLTFS